LEGTGTGKVGLEGQFVQHPAPPPGGGGSSEVSETLGTVAPLTITAASPLLGDLNNDGTVNAVDLAIFSQDFGKAGAGLKGDLNNDGVVNAIDLALFASNFGKTAS
jgi:hypothetical protein